MKRCLQIKNQDNVATALTDVLSGEKVDVYNDENIFLFSLIAKENIPFGNKIALFEIQKGLNIIKYNSNIGEASQNIERACLVHVHNIKSINHDIPLNIKKEIIHQMNIKTNFES